MPLLVFIMNNEESLNLYREGKEAWNKWAREMLAKKAELEKDGLWQTDNVKQTHNQAMEEWISEASVVFSGNLFEEEMNFHNFIFPYKMDFSHTNFLEKVKFDGATFCGEARFDKAIFSNYAGFKCATFSGGAGFENATFSGGAGFENATFSGGAGFVDATFSGKARFNKAIFGNHASFMRAQFSGGARFKNVTFSGDAVFGSAAFGVYTSFDDATFSDDASFEGAEFSGNATFTRVKFFANARLEEAQFNGDVKFESVLFKGFADFSSANFKQQISVIGTQGNGYFSFKNTHFYSVPDFNQAHFIEAPEFNESDFSKVIKDRQYYDNAGIKKISSHWRSLKRLAIQAHDHKMELFFFAEEIKSQRGVEDKALPNLHTLVAADKQVWPGGLQFWLGVLYETFSDFGRSVWRPVLWLVVFTFLFFLIYWNPLTTQNWETTHITPSCERTEAALYLTIRHAFPIFFVASPSKKLDQSYDCLSGQVKNQSVIVSNMVIYVGVVQTAISTMLIFLVLLALRNHFKIK